MDAVAKSEIFFVITSGAVVVLTILLVWALVYVLRILRDIKDISEILRAKTKDLSEDFREMRETIRSRGFALRHIKKLFNIVRRATKGRSPKD